MRTFLAFGIACLLALLPTQPAFSAAEAGSHGWSREILILHSGPGARYGVTGQIPAEVAIKILRCQQLWCNVEGPGGRGWTSRNLLDFGKNPHWPVLDADNDWPDLVAGSMCFYEGANYSGRSFCASSGEVFLDLATWGWDNRIRSIRVATPTSAAVCRDRGFQSYCERIVSSQARLAPLLSRNLSSIRIY